jgi:Flp pilus assembly protein TadG
MRSFQRAPRRTGRLGAGGGGYLRRHSRSGSVLLWFMVISLPIAFFVCSETVDLSRVYLVHREVSNAAFSAAEAGAQDITNDGVTLVLPATGANHCGSGSDPAGSDAYDVTNATWARELVVDAVPADAHVTSIAVCVAQPGDNEVAVTVNYQVRGLIFGANSGVNEAGANYSVTATAFVCIPGQTNLPTQGYCATSTNF